jgi:hypothetical protein
VTVRDLIRRLEMFDQDAEVLAEERVMDGIPYPFFAVSDGKVYL